MQETGSAVTEDALIPTVEKNTISQMNQKDTFCEQ